MLNKPLVYYPKADPLVVQMFHKHGFGLAVNVLDADLLCFVGGEDVSPSYYGEDALASTFVNEYRDKREAELFEKTLKLPKVGICRGGQFLNVMSGGEMWQDVDKHAVGKSGHIMVDLLHNKEIQVSSTHHQMMRVGEGARVIGIAYEATKFVHNKKESPPLPDYDIEIVAYEASNSLCFQPHPEFGNVEEQNLFFTLLEELWDLKGSK